MYSHGALDSLRKVLAPYQRIGVAYSGGVDSATLLAASAKILGANQVIAFLGVSSSLAGRERIGAHRVAEELGVRLIEIPTDEMSNPDYLANNGNRCYFCKDALFSAINAFDFTEFNIEAIAYGENADDSLRSDRPGQLAAQQWGAIKPLSEAGLTKSKVRELARELNLSVAEKPASPCLASRIKPFTPVSTLALAQVELVEDFLLQNGFNDIRARFLGDHISLEAPAEEMSLLHSENLQRKVRGFELLHQLPPIQFSTAPLVSGSFSRLNLESTHV